MSASHTSMRKSIRVLEELMLLCKYDAIMLVSTCELLLVLLAISFRWLFSNGLHPAFELKKWKTRDQIWSAVHKVLWAFPLVMSGLQKNFRFQK